MHIFTLKFQDKYNQERMSVAKRREGASNSTVVESRLRMYVHICIDSRLLYYL